MPTKKTPKKTGRPFTAKEIEEQALTIVESMLALDAKFPQIQIQFLKNKPPIKLSRSTIKRMIKRKYKMTYEQFSEKSREDVNLTLKQKAIQMAHGGNVVMLIFCLKNLSGWTDKTVIENAKPIEISLNYKLDKDGTDD